jgi:PPK2 family polyphosphate:nucleotide phosphotransferase
MLAKKQDKKGKVHLSSIPTDDDGGMNRESAEKRFAKLSTELFDLQELLYAAGTHALLVVLQGRDTAGKDGTLKAVAGAMNPTGVDVVSFKVPTPLEGKHDFLWRVHSAVPGHSEVVFFNRSHYEDVLVVRVHELVPKSVWKRRYDHINAFEDLLTDSNIIVIKFYLHISKDEQERRLFEREQDPQKAWKLSAGDWQERKYWDAYTAAYEDAIEKCATEKAPWFIVPADKKWFRNLAVAEAIAETLRPYRSEWLKHLEKVGEVERKALVALRASATKS